MLYIIKLILLIESSFRIRNISSGTYDGASILEEWTTSLRKIKFDSDVNLMCICIKKSLKNKGNVVQNTSSILQGDPPPANLKM